MARGVDFDTQLSPAGTVIRDVNGGVVNIVGGLYSDGLPVMGHVLSPQEWGNSAGLHYWAFFGNAGQLTAGNAHELSASGWTTTALSLGGGQTGDFLASADQDPPYLDFGASGDLLQSPAIFGDYGVGQMWKQFLGADPTTINLEVYASFPVGSVSETTSAFGFTTGAPATAANHRATIHSNGSNFRLRNNGGGDVGAAIDTGWHLFKIQLGPSVIEWWIDAVSQGTLAYDSSDVWPASFGCHTSTTNRIRISWLHAWPEA